MDFLFKKPPSGNAKPIMQHVGGNTLTEWRVADDQNSIVVERTLVNGYNGPRAGTFFLGGMETTRDELAEYLAEASERNAAPRPDRTADIEKKIWRAREQHAQVIRDAVQGNIPVPKRQPQKKGRYLLVPRAVGMQGPDGQMIVAEVNR